MIVICKNWQKEELEYAYGLKHSEAAILIQDDEIEALRACLDFYCAKVDSLYTPLLSKLKYRLLDSEIAGAIQCDGAHECEQLILSEAQKAMDWRHR